MKKKATICVREVTWSGTKPLKYQASLSWDTEKKGRVIRILGDPMPTQETAMKSLKEEYTTWAVAMHAFRAALTEPTNEEQTDV